MAEGNLLQLDDVLLVICAHLDPDTLYNLALASRHLYYLVLPVYYTRNGLSSRETGTTFVFGPRLKALPVLCNALFLPQIHHLSCSFTYPSSTLITELSNLRGAVLRIASIPKITVAFTADGGWSPLMYQPTCWTDEWRQGLREAFQALVVTLFQASPCVRICHGMHLATQFSPEAEPRYPTPNRTRRFSLKRLFGSRIPKNQVIALQNVLKPKHKPALTHPTNPITHTFSLESPALLAPILNPWFTQTLSRIPLKHLTINKLGLDTRAWAKCLPTFVIPTLTKLTLNQSSSISIQDLSYFLARHPTIHTLELDEAPCHPLHRGTTNTSMPPAPIMTIGFANIKFLTVSKSALGFFSLLPLHLPKLEEVVLQVLVGHGERVHLDTVLPDVTSARWYAWAAVTSDQERQRQRAQAQHNSSGPNETTVQVSLHLRSATPYSTTQWLGSVLAAPAASSSASTSASASLAPNVHILSAIKKLDIDWWYFVKPESDLPFLIEWLAAFPALQSLVFSEAPKKELKESQGGAWATRWGTVVEGLRAAKPGVDIRI